MDKLKNKRVKLLRKLDDVNQQILEYQNNCLHLHVDHIFAFDGHKNEHYYQCTYCNKTLDTIKDNQMIKNTKHY